LNPANRKPLRCRGLAGLAGAALKLVDRVLDAAATRCVGSSGVVLRLVTLSLPQLSSRELSRRHWALRRSPANRGRVRVSSSSSAITSLVPLGKWLHVLTPFQSSSPIADRITTQAANVGNRPRQRTNAPACQRFAIRRDDA